MTLLFFFGVWEIGKASTTIQVFLTAVWEQCLFIHYSKSVTPLTLHAELISGVRSVHVHRFVCQVHIWGSQWPSDTHSVWKVQESRCTGDEKKEAFLGLCFGLFVPQSALSLFSQICQCHLGLWVIFYPHCLTDRGGSGFVRIKVECWDKFCPSARQCRSGQPQVTSSAG